MTFWIYNPSEPTGQPTEPGPWDAPGQTTGFDGADLFTRGRCGECGACPKVWKLTVPEINGDPLAAHYAGTFYLNRIGYRQSAGFLQETEICAWASVPVLPLPDRNAFLEHDSLFNIGWLLAFRYDFGLESFRWIIDTPRLSDGLNGFQSRYFSNKLHWFCLQENALQLFGGVSDFDYPYTPPIITVTPFPA